MDEIYYNKKELTSNFMFANEYHVLVVKKVIDFFLFRKVQ